MTTGWPADPGVDGAVSGRVFIFGGWARVARHRLGALRNGYEATVREGSWLPSWQLSYEKKTETMEKRYVTGRRNWQ